MSNLTLQDDKASGFTIVELLIATTVFAVILLGALAGFLEIGRLFYKGVSATSTQSIANQILQDVSGEFQNAAGFTKVLPKGDKDTVGGNLEVLPTTDQSGSGNASYAYYCIGNTRYTYNIAKSGSQAVSFSSTPNHAPGGNFGILRDVIAGGGSSACAPPCSDTSPAPACESSKGQVKLSNPVELLGDNMRLSAFYINSSNATSNLFNITIIVTYGLDDAFTQNPPTSVPPVCSGSSQIDQFCSVATISTAVYRGWNQ